MDEEKWKEGAIRGREEKKNTNPKTAKPEQHAQNPRKNPKTDDPQPENPIKINQNRNRNEFKRKIKKQRCKRMDVLRKKFCAT